MFFSPVLTALTVVLAQAPQAWSGDCVSTTNLDVAQIQGLECVFRNVVSVVVPLAGLAVFVMLLVGGIKYLTSGGDPKASEQAKNTLTYAILGLVAIVAAYLILNFIATFAGVDALKTFTIPGPVGP